MTPESVTSMKLMLEADQALTVGGDQAAIQGYLEAIIFAEKAPQEDQLFARDLMIAYCNAGLSYAYGRQGEFVESLAFADRATKVLGEKFNSNSPIDAQRLTMAFMSRIHALIKLQRRDEAEKALCEAKSTLTRISAWSTEDRENLGKLEIQLSSEDN